MVEELLMVRKLTQDELCAKGTCKFIHISGSLHRCNNCGKEIRVEVVK